jgi:hypothetical protein
VGKPKSGVGGGCAPFAVDALGRTERGWFRRITRSGFRPSIGFLYPTRSRLRLRCCDWFRRRNTVALRFVADAIGRMGPAALHSPRSGLKVTGDTAVHPRYFPCHALSGDEARDGFWVDRMDGGGW